MMHVLLTGGSGKVGRFIASRLLKEGHHVTFLGRSEPWDERIGFLHWDLSEDRIETLPPADALVHCALFHEPNLYRGGEGDHPDQFWALNVEGTHRLFEAAVAIGIRRCIFLSSRAVYTNHGCWETLTEASETDPDTFYGKVKLAGEQKLEALCSEQFHGSVVRATGVYGLPAGLRTHKWDTLFNAFRRGELIAPRVATELHGDDLAEAVMLLLHPGRERDHPFEVYNASDLLLDRQDLLKIYAKATGCNTHLPERAPGPLGVMEPDKLKEIGWAPGGMSLLRDFVSKVTAHK